MVVVTRLDRMARSTRDLLNILTELNHKKAGFRSLNDPWADTTTPQGRLIVTIMGGMAEFERELIRARTNEGRARAVAAGVKLGPKTHPGTASICVGATRGGEKHQVIASAFNVSCSTISRLKPMDGQPYWMPNLDGKYNET
ncbi:recombinase family protein [Bradyrhizobium sp. CCGUVB14]|nr:recombinase family protein [Bradyrhizobium sp. CCGUVB14]MCP3441054.1 recombinase family protein [Bradyrhizobium sp. CCGUVB14]